MFINKKMKFPKIVTMYRVKNESRWIKKSIESVSKISDEIIILDDGSTDNTIEICESFNTVIEIHKQKNIPYDETRDKNILLKKVLKRNPDFILSLDGDEILQSNTRDILFEEICVLHPKINVFEFQALFMWEHPRQYRYDGVYSNTWWKRLLRMENQPKALEFKNTQFNNNAHCPAIPPNAIGIEESVRSNCKIFHYGNYDESLRQHKYQFYNDIDPYNKIFDGYKHIISGKSSMSGSNGIRIKTINSEVDVPIIK
jgi:glycosyltransferase involved in cell wall biosynthesis